MRELTVGSVCTGYGGLELALALAGIEHRLAWVADPDPAATAVLAHHYPDVPNLGDITTVDWSAAESIDCLLAGYPCQGFSLAGQRKGIEDERFVWPFVADAVRVLRPGVVVLENVAGHRSLGFGRVLGDLAAIGYDAVWVSVRASDVGAAHQRERVFVLAHPADAAGHAGRLLDGDGGPLAGARGAGADPVLTLLPTPRTSDTNGAGVHWHRRHGSAYRRNDAASHADRHTLWPPPEIAVGRSGCASVAGRTDAAATNPDGRASRTQRHRGPTRPETHDLCHELDPGRCRPRRPMGSVRARDRPLGVRFSAGPHRNQPSLARTDHGWPRGLWSG